MTNGYNIIRNQLTDSIVYLSLWSPISGDTAWSLIMQNAKWKYAKECYLTFALILFLVLMKSLGGMKSTLFYSIQWSLLSLILHCALCCEVSRYFISWFFKAYGDKDKDVGLSKHYFNIIKAFIRVEPVMGKLTHVFIVASTSKHYDQNVWVGVNTCGHFWCVWIVTNFNKAFHPLIPSQSQDSLSHSKIF